MNEFNGTAEQLVNALRELAERSSGAIQAIAKAAAERIEQMEAEIDDLAIQISYGM